MQVYNFKELFHRFHNREWDKSEESFIDKGIFKNLRQYGFLAGGAVRRIVSGKELNSDFDFFFESQDKLAAAAAILKESGQKKIKENEFNQEWQAWDYLSRERKIQLISHQPYSCCETLFDSFDFTICQFALDNISENLYVGDYSLYDLGRNRLVPHKITYPLASSRRVLKYSNQGFYACAGCLRAILEAAILNPASLDETQYID